MLRESLRLSMQAIATAGLERAAYGSSILREGKPFFGADADF